MYQRADTLYNYLPSSESERHSFNVVFQKLLNERDTDEASVFKLLSGVRTAPGQQTKVGKATVRVWIRRWHRSGLVTLIHGRLRLGPVGLYADLLSSENKKRIIRMIDHGR